MPFDGVARAADCGRRPKREIIGVVGDVTLDVYGAPTLVVYHAHRQFADNRNWALSQVVATELPPERMLAAVRAAIAALDPELVVHRPAPMTEVVGRGSSRERFALVLMGAFAGVSLLLAALGLYGVLAYTVRQRTQEIGIRMALGASAAQVRALMLRQAALVLGVGLVAGIRRRSGARTLAVVARLRDQSVGPSNPAGHRVAAHDHGSARGVAARTARLASGARNRDAGRVLRRMFPKRATVVISLLRPCVLYWGLSNRFPPIRTRGPHAQRQKRHDL